MELQVQGKVSVGSNKLFYDFVENKRENQGLEIQHEPVIDNVDQHNTTTTSQSTAIDPTINQPIATKFSTKEEFLKDLEG
jgi:hypothetical protein